MSSLAWYTSLNPPPLAYGETYSRGRLVNTLTRYGYFWIWLTYSLVDSEVEGLRSDGGVKPMGGVAGARAIEGEGASMLATGATPLG